MPPRKTGEDEWHRQITEWKKRGDRVRKPAGIQKSPLPLRAKKARNPAFNRRSTHFLLVMFEKWRMTQSGANPSPNTKFPANRELSGSFRPKRASWMGQRNGMPRCLNHSTVCRRENGTGNSCGGIREFPMPEALISGKLRSPSRDRGRIGGHGIIRSVMAGGPRGQGQPPRLDIPTRVSTGPYSIYRRFKIIAFPPSLH